MATVRLQGRLVVNFTIHALTGLHIGAQQTGVEIGDIDLPILRDPITRRPLVPGSSLKGKMRSLVEKAYGAVQNTRVGQARIHTCLDERQHLDARAYRTCVVCPVFGIPAPHANAGKDAELVVTTLTRLTVRDARLSDAAEKRLSGAGLDLQYAEAKTEVAIDRITARAVPRTQERAPAGSEFDAQLVYSIFEDRDYGLFTTVLEALAFVEDDCLGGQGSRGSGRVHFKNLTLEGRSTRNYAAAVPLHPGTGYASVAEAIADGELQARLRKAVPPATT